MRNYSIFLKICCNRVCLHIFSFPGSHSISPPPPIQLNIYFLQIKTEKKKKQRPACKCSSHVSVHSRFSHFPSHMVSWFLSVVVLHSAMNHSARMSTSSVMCSVASPTRLHAFKLNMHHISGNVDLPTVPFISSVCGNNAATFRRLPVEVGLLLGCLLCSKLA